MVLYFIGLILMIEAAFLCLPLLVSFLYGESCWRPFAVTILIALLCGAGLHYGSRPEVKTVYAKEGFVIVALSWIFLSLVGALPFTLSGEIPSYLDAVFETISGFTTTGSSIVTDVESMSHGILFWRSFTHWLGGMGVLVFMLAILPQSGGQAIHLLRAESPGPTVTKMVPKLRQSAAILYGIYMVMTVAEILLLLLGGMPLFDSLCHAFGTAGTGGLSIKSSSIAAYDSYYLQGVISVFMLLFGVNFSVYFFIMRKKWGLVAHNSELRVYLAIIAASTLAITLNIRSMYPSAFNAFHHAFFTVNSIITTTGYSTENFDLWPEFSRLLLVMLMMVGACAGSTGGGIKVTRFIISAKAIASDLRRLIHPRSVKVIAVDGKRVENDTVRAVNTFLHIYFFITVASILLVSLDDLDATTTVTAVIANLNNIGPGLSLVGPAGSYAMFSPLSKIVLCLDMLFGRLEIFPMLYVLMPSTWRSSLRPVRRKHL
jgi:trk system potassium uptake protein TrkH